MLSSFRACLPQDECPVPDALTAGIATTISLEPAYTVEYDALDSPAASSWAAADQTRAVVFGANAYGCLGAHSTTAEVAHQLCGEPAPECAAVVLAAAVYQNQSWSVSLQIANPVQY